MVDQSTWHSKIKMETQKVILFKVYNVYHGESIDRYLGGCWVHIFGSKRRGSKGGDVSLNTLTFPLNNRITKMNSISTFQACKTTGQKCSVPKEVSLFVSSSFYQTVPSCINTDPAKPNQIQCLPKGFQSLYPANKGVRTSQLI